MKKEKEMEQFNIGQRLYDLRIERDIQQGELARALNMNQSVLNRIERGTRPARDCEVRDMAIYFHVSADLLLGLPVSRTPGLHLTPGEHTLITRFRALDKRGQSNVAETAKREYDFLQSRGGKAQEEA